MTTAPEKSQPDSARSQAELLEELRALRRRVRELEEAEARWQRAEAALRENRLRLQAVVSDAPIILWKLDADGVFTFAEGRGLERLGLKPADVVGTSALKRFAKSPRVANFLRRALGGESVMATIEYGGRSFEVCCEPLRDENGPERVTGVIGVSTDVTEHHDAAACLQAVVEGTSSATGKRFFRALAQHLAEALRTKGALVCEVTDDQQHRLAPLAMWFDGALMDELPTAGGGPCREVVRHGVLYVPSCVADRFHDAPWLKDGNIESYLGVALVNSAGRVIGSLGVVDDKPFKDREFAEPILRVFAARAAAELERQRADDAIRESQRRLIGQNHALAQLSKLEAIGQGKLDDAIRAITEVAADTIETERVNVWFYDQQHTKICCVDQFERTARRHSDGQELTAREFPSYFKALEERRIIAASDAMNDPRTREFRESYLKPHGIGALLDAPIRVAGQMVGVICHEHVGPPRSWTLEEEQFAASMADYVALALEARDRRRAEEALRRARDELEQRVEERTARLTQTNRRLRSEIEERRKTEAALRRSEARFRRLFESNIIGVFFSHLDGRITDANDAFLRMLGYDRDDLPLDWNALTPPEWKSDAEQHVEELLTDGAAPARERECVRKDGSRVPVYLGAARMESNPDVCVAFVVDLTEQKGAERALAQSEERLRSLVSTAPDFILVLDNEDRIQFINRTVPGVAVDEILGKNAYKLIESAYHQRIRACLDRVRQTGEFGSFDLLTAGVRGVPTWYTVRVGPFMQDDRIVGVTLIARDVTDRKQMEEALRESETKFRQLANTVAAAAFIYQDDRLKYVNQAASRITGYSEEELLALPLKKIVHPEHHDLFGQRLRRHEEGEPAPPHYEVRILCKDGRQRWVDFVAGDIEYEGRPALLGTAFDITDRKQAEEELLGKQEFLKRLLNAHERDRQLTAYEIHDGLVQDITAAKMHFEAFRRQQTVLSNRGAKEFDRGLELLSETIREARRLISGLRPPIIDERGIVAAIDYLINERNTDDDLAIDFVHDVSFNRLDPVTEGAVFRIVQEALTNVYRHSKAERARVALRQLDDRMQIEIRDWGVGFQVSDVSGNRFGLQGIRERARLLRGNATIESHPGQGTRVAVELPVQYAEARQIDGSDA